MLINAYYARKNLKQHSKKPISARIAVYENMSFNRIETIWYLLLSGLNIVMFLFMSTFQVDYYMFFILGTAHIIMSFLMWRMAKMVFGKKKKQEEDVSMHTHIAQASIGEQVPLPPKDIEEKRELTAEEKEVLAKFNYYFKNYNNFYGISDIAQMPSGTIQAEQMNLLFGIFCELKEIKECLLRLEEKE